MIGMLIEHYEILSPKLSPSGSVDLLPGNGPDEKTRAIPEWVKGGLGTGCSLQGASGLRVYTSAPYTILRRESDGG
jgi:hypothetical protein